MNTQTLVSLARDIAVRISVTVKETRDLGAYVGTIGMGGDRTKKGDERVEQELRVVLPIVLKKYGIASAMIISEETGQWIIGSPADDSGIFCIIDPIDGSNNMRPHSTPKPFLGFSIGVGTMRALREYGTLNAISAGVIRDIFHDEEYYAGRGIGAYFNDSLIHASPYGELTESVIGTSLDRSGERLDRILNGGLLDILRATKCQRRIGSTALDLCRVATGDYDAYVSLSGDVKVHDIAAAVVIIEEAQGIFSILQDGVDVSQRPWLRELMERGSAGLRDITFEVITAGQEDMFQSLLRTAGKKVASIH